MGSLHSEDEEASGPLATDLSMGFASPHLSEVEEGRRSADLGLPHATPNVAAVPAWIRRLETSRLQTASGRVRY
jgi:hypothetical protein